MEGLSHGDRLVAFEDAGRRRQDHTNYWFNAALISTRSSQHSPSIGLWRCMHLTAAEVVDSLLVWCWASVCDAGPTSSQQWIGVSRLRSYAPVVEIRKANRADEQLAMTNEALWPGFVNNKKASAACSLITEAIVSFFLFNWWWLVA